MKYVLSFCVIATIVLLVMHRMDTRYAEGLADGRRTALNLNPPSEALEVACLSLWVGNENKKAWKKQKI